MQWQGGVPPCFDIILASSLPCLLVYTISTPGGDCPLFTSVLVLAGGEILPASSFMPFKEGIPLVHICFNASLQPPQLDEVLPPDHSSHGSSLGWAQAWPQLSPQLGLEVFLSPSPRRPSLSWGIQAELSCHITNIDNDNDNDSLSSWVFRCDHKRSCAITECLCVGAAGTK